MHVLLKDWGMKVFGKSDKDQCQAAASTMINSGL